MSRKPFQANKLQLNSGGLQVKGQRKICSHSVTHIPHTHILTWVKLERLTCVGLKSTFFTNPSNCIKLFSSFRTDYTDGVFTRTVSSELYRFLFLVYVFLIFLFTAQCSRLSWPSVSFLAHYRYFVSYRIVSYLTRDFHLHVT